MFYSALCYDNFLIVDSLRKGAIPHTQYAHYLCKQLHIQSGSTEDKQQHVLGLLKQYGSDHLRIDSEFRYRINRSTAGIDKSFIFIYKKKNPEYNTVQDTGLGRKGK